MWATINETVSVQAKDADEAAEIALQIVRSGRIACSSMDWEVEEVNIGDPLDVAE
jgi:uncharacterized protein involved in tolerance to divalent cations